MEKPEIVLSIEKWLFVFEVLQPILFYIYPIAAAIIATVASHDTGDKWLKELSRNLAVSYLTAAIFLWIADMNITEIADSGKMFYGYTAIVLFSPVFYKQLLSDELVRKLIKFFVLKKLGVNPKEIKEEEDKESKENDK